MNEEQQTTKYSIGLTTILVGIVILVVFGFSLYFTINVRVKEFVNYHETISNNATDSISNEIERILRQKRQLVETFLEDNLELVSDVAQFPDDEQRYLHLNQKLGRYFSDFFSTNITTSRGELVVDDFEGDIGDLCLEDVQKYLHHGMQLVRIHPNPKIYHYDILVDFDVDEKKKIFIVTFGADDLFHLLKTATPTGHDIIISNTLDDIIEITKIGSRDAMANRDDYRLTDSEKQNIHSTTPITGSYWNVVDLIDPALFSEYRAMLNHQAAKQYTFFLVLMALMSLAVLYSVRRKNQLETFLIEKNRQINRLNNELEQLSLTDSLTGLNNRRYLEIKSPVGLDISRRLNVPFSVALIDIDYFKKFNDTHGHQAGDACLQQIASLMEDHFRRTNEILARYGGEEFIIINIGDEFPEFIRHLQAYSAAVSDYMIRLDDQVINDSITISIGVTSVTGDPGITIHDIIKQADQAMYAAKAAGRNRLVTYSSLDQ
ncbi:MAG: GGDEF domain-containing protein [Arenicellales bacterium]